MDQHNLLARQLGKYFSPGEAVSRELQPFIKAVNEAYQQSDIDRGLLERSLELSSEELLRANSELRAITLASPDLFFRLDRQGKILDYSTGSSHDLYLPPAEFMGKIIGEVLPPPVAEQTMEALRKVSESNALVTFEYDLPLPAGIQSYEARLFPLPGGQVEAVVRNITERKRAEEYLRESEERYKALFSEALDGIALADAETGILIDCNPALAALVGRERVELIGQSQSILHPITGDRNAFSPTFKQHLGEKMGQVLEAQVVTSTSEIREVEIKANPLQIRGKKMLQGIFRDITERKQMEEQINEKMDELKLINDAAVGRELKMIELEKEIDELLVELGRKPKYK